MGREAALEDVSAAIVTAVQGDREGCQQTLHEAAEIRLPGPQVQMEVIRHAAIAQQAHLELPAELPQSLQKQLVVLRLGEDGLPPVPAIGHMVVRAGVLNPQRTSHTYSFHKTQLAIRAILPPPRFLINHGCAMCGCDPAAVPGTANLPIGILGTLLLAIGFLGLLQTANQEIGGPGEFRAQLRSSDLRVSGANPAPQPGAAGRHLSVEVRYSRWDNGLGATQQCMLWDIIIDFGTWEVYHSYNAARVGQQIVYAKWSVLHLEGLP